MAKRLQLRGGTTSQHSTFTGALREVTVDTDKDTLVVHDGATAGGFPLATATNLTALSATNLTSGTVPDARFPSALPAIDGSALTGIDTNATHTGDVTGATVLTIANNAVTSQKIGYAEATLTDGATVTWNAETQDVCKLTLGGNRTLAAPTSATTGQFISILIIQDGTGGRTITWNAVYEFAADTAPTLTATANLGDLFTFRYNGTKWLEIGRNLALTLS